jgi:hypothetical protein
MEKKILNTLNEVSMLLSVFIKRNTSQTTLIKELSEVGFQPKRIAEILGTTSNTVRVALHNFKKSRGKKNKKIQHG